jgi:FAD:protein FMN transferase
MVGRHGGREQIHPLDDDRCPLEDFIQAQLNQLGVASKSVKIRVNERHAPRVFVDQGEGGTGDVAVDRNLQTLGDALRQRGLSGAQLPRQADDVPDAHGATQQTTNCLHIVRCRGLDLDGPGGWAAGDEGFSARHGIQSLAAGEAGFNCFRRSKPGIGRHFRPDPVLCSRGLLRRISLCAVVAVAALPMATAPRATAQALVAHVFSRTYRAMGTDVVLTAYTADDASAESGFGAAMQEIRRLERLMTDWEWPGQPPSDVLRINGAAGRQAVKVADETLEVIAKALDMSRRSEGAFDITYAVMRGLWKFDQDLEKKIPPAAEIARRRRLIAWRDVIVDQTAKTVKLRRPGMRLGLGGIAKGYAVDRAAAILRGQGLVDFMVQAGGDLYVSGQKGPSSWMVGVRDPRGQARDVIAKMPIKDHAFSTAGDYERAFVLDGKRYHHIIDPKTGYPATASRGVTILAPNAFLADALDDAVFILGPKKGLALCAQFPDTATVIVDAHNKVWMSPSLEGKLVLTGTPQDGI